MLDQTEQRDREKNRAQNCIGPRIHQIEQAVSVQINMMMRDPQAVEKCLDDIADIHRWPRFCIYLSMLLDAEAGNEQMAISRLRSMFHAAMADSAMDVVMKDLGVH